MHREGGREGQDRKVALHRRYDVSHREQEKG